MMRARAEGRFEPEKVEALRQLLKHGMTFVDAGSNKGDFALIAARLMNDEGRVLAFEPSPENCYWIRKSIDLNGYRCITLHELALSDGEGRAALYMGERSGWHSLLPGEDPGDSIEVATRTLDAVLAESGDARAEVIKIDVEGAELRVLGGAERTLADPRSLAVLIDVHPGRGIDPAAVAALLTRHGFSLRDPADIAVELPGPPQGARELVAIRPSGTRGPTPPRPSG